MEGAQPLLFLLFENLGALAIIGCLNSTVREVMASQRCSNCNSVLHCGAERKGDSCWCFAFPPVLVADSNKRCLCPSCLGQAVVDRIDELIASQGVNHLVELASQYRVNDQFIEHIDYTVEKGKYVFSKWYHLKRGSCCGNRCRNCPYTDWNNL